LELDESEKVPQDLVYGSVAELKHPSHPARRITTGKKVARQK
jgi:hypothetical protein